jgi:hypothetical protein
VLGAAMLLASLAIKFRLTPFIAFLTSTLFLAIFLIGAFRYHIGRGLTEILAMIFMMLAAWFLCQGREGCAKRVSLATLFAMLCFWTRQDHIGVIAGLAFLILEPVSGPTNGWLGYWGRFKLCWKPMTWYWGMGILSTLVIYLRHWFMGAGFHLYLDPMYVVEPPDVLTKIKILYLILTGSHWPIMPSISGVLISMGTFLGLTALVWHRKSLLNFPRSIGISLLGLLFPFLFVQFNIVSYPPRYSINLLPLALLSLVIFLDQFIKNRLVSAKSKGY